MRFPRSSGILMPVFCLPDGPSIGDFGPSAYRFVDFLQASGQTIWQLLPFGPPAAGNSPYSSFSAFAGNPLLISCRMLVEDGLLTDQQLADCGHDNQENYGVVNYEQAAATKQPLLAAAFVSFQSEDNAERRTAFDNFCEHNDYWLTDYVRFEVLATEQQMFDWSRWDPKLVRRDPAALAEVDQQYAEQIQLAKFLQFVFYSQWHKLKAYANEKNVRMYGDMPIFVAYESADVWMHQDLYFLDDNGRPTVVAGVPPDYFSETGQMWGNPLYRWDRLAETDYGWWTRRFRQAFENFDILRIDHFRGFESFWEIPADAENAIGGEWKPGPGEAPFKAAFKALGQLAIVAEDLGLITDQVHELREQLGFPGMRVLQFGVDSDHDPYHRPDSYPEHSFAYTGTHDNDTVLGWYQQRQRDGANCEIVDRFLTGRQDHIHVDLIASVLNSSAATAVIPMQDLLGLGSDCRTNTPGEPHGNWSWRCTAQQFQHANVDQLKEMTQHAGRISSPS